LTDRPGGGSASTSSGAAVPWLVLAVGGLLLLLGLLAAFRTLPEWGGGPGSRAGRVARVEADLAPTGGRLLSPLLKLAGASIGESYERAFRRLGRGATPYLEATGGAVWYRVSGNLVAEGAGSGAFEADLAPDGTYRGFSWYPGGALAMGTVDEGIRKKREAVYDRLEGLLAGGAALGPADSTMETNVPVVTRSLETPRGGVPETLLRIQPPNGIVLRRQAADPDAIHWNTADAIVQKLLRTVLPLLVSVGLVLFLFGRLLYRRRLDFRIAVGLALLVLVSSALTGPDPDGQIVFTALRIGLHLVALAYLVAQWAVAESLLRDSIPGFTTSLDTLVAGRLGPRAGRAILAGLGAGAALEGLTLLAHSGAALLSPVVVPTRPSFSLPFFRLVGNPFYEGAAIVSTLVLFVALARAVLPRKWADPSGGLVAALFLSLAVPFAPWGAALLAAVAACAGGLFVLQRFGLASLLAATVAAPFFRDAAASAHLITGNLQVLVLATGMLLALALIGFAGLLRTPRDEDGKVEAPGYLQRLESERRVKVEMDLLSRMQLALLPQKAPEVPGLKVAFSSVLATEVGGDLYHFEVDGKGQLWIAAGDVSGHGYSCGIQGAMVKASLLSLVKADRTPAEVLQEIDRVLRAAGETRLFTTLALIRVDPSTGEAVWSNAGHPFPFLVDEGVCHELASPGLPLGQGPAREYRDERFSLPPQGLLVMASDGLFEAIDLFGEPYGYDRPRAVLSSVGLWRRPAEGIVDACFADWRRHAGEGAPSDDTTVVVVKRAG
jgi:Stage II sporulation protein E (SpoIIE)